MNTQTELLINLLDCGTLDVDKLIEIVDTCEDFNNDALSDSIENLKDNGIKLDCNSLMFELLDNLRIDLNAKIMEELNIELLEDDFELFINYLDTHITYLGDNEQVKEWLENNCDLVEF